MSLKQIIIAIDGYSSCGKSTLSKQLAKHFKYNYIDSGAMYRAVTLFALRNNFIQNRKVKETELIEALPSIKISFKFNPETEKSDTYLNGENIENEIRLLEVSNNVSPVATIKAVRHEMVKQQQDMGLQKGIVMDGRDIGTVVFPQAELKLFMTTTPETRAQRRYDELKAKGESISYEAILENVKQRDHIDSTRKESPLTKASDALVLDNSHLSHEEQFNWAVNEVNKAIQC